jgi:hypothetical protein
MHAGPAAFFYRIAGTGGDGVINKLEPPNCAELEELKGAREGSGTLNTLARFRTETHNRNYEAVNRLPGSIHLVSWIYG